jgi:hypothetical protein
MTVAGQLVARSMKSVKTVVRTWCESSQIKSNVVLYGEHSRLQMDNTRLNNIQ